MSLEDGSEDT